MLIQNPILSLLSVSLLVPLGLCVPASPASFSLSLNSNRDISIATTSTNPPFRYNQLHGLNETEVLAFSDAYLPHYPTWLRRIPALGPIRILWWAMQKSVAHLPREEEVGKGYITFGPEYSPNINFLDVRVSIRQFNEGDWEERDVKSEKLKNKDIATTAELGPLILGDDEREGAHWMCYIIAKTGEVTRCVGMMTVQRDVWKGKSRKHDDT